MVIIHLNLCHGKGHTKKRYTIKTLHYKNTTLQKRYTTSLLPVSVCVKDFKIHIVILKINHNVRTRYTVGNIGILNFWLIFTFLSYFNNI